MLDCRMTAREWDELLGVGSGDVIVSNLTYYYDHAPELAPSLSCLEERLSNMLGGVDLIPQGTTLLSVGRVEQAIGQLQASLPPCVWEPMNERVAGVFRGYLGADLWFLLRRSGWWSGVPTEVGNRWECIEQGVWESLRNTPWTSFSNCFGHTHWANLLRDRLVRNFRYLLCAQVACLATASEDAREAAARTEKILALFRDGNFPVGRLEDETYSGSLLVLVA